MKPTTTPDEIASPAEATAILPVIREHIVSNRAPVAANLGLPGAAFW
jgi:hypothetical protein